MITTEEFDDEYRKNVCRMGQGHACCRYITVGPSGWGCEKNTSLRATIDQRVEGGHFTARGDNCEGVAP